MLSHTATCGELESQPHGWLTACMAIEVEASVDGTFLLTLCQQGFDSIPIHFFRLYLYFCIGIHYIGRCCYLVLYILYLSLLHYSFLLPPIFCCIPQHTLSCINLQCHKIESLIDSGLSVQFFRKSTALETSKIFSPQWHFSISF